MGRRVHIEKAGRRGPAVNDLRVDLGRPGSAPGNEASGPVPTKVIYLLPG